MGNVTAMSAKYISPDIVLQYVAEALPDIQTLYVVAIMKDGEPLVAGSGDLSELCFCAKVLDNLATRYINGEIEE